MPDANKIDTLFTRDPFGWFAGFARDKCIATKRDSIQQVMVAATCDDANAAHGLRTIVVGAWLRARDAQTFQVCAYSQSHPLDSGTPNDLHTVGTIVAKTGDLQIVIQVLNNLVPQCTHSFSPSWTGIFRLTHRAARAFISLPRQR